MKNYFMKKIMRISREYMIIINGTNKYKSYISCHTLSF